MKKKAVIYARFSSHSQTEQSIEGQLRECYDFAKRSDIIIVGEYIDRALTGTSDKRPEFLKMIDDSRKKTFDYVLVYQLDRFARNRYDSANYKAKLKKNGVRVLSAKENITDDASGILVEGMLESMAQYYSAELSQKVKRGIKESLIKGNFIGGYGLFGYDIVDKKWTINTFEADTVRDMFERYKNGEKGKEIIDRLNAQGIKTKAGSSFNMNSFARIIRNEKYIGRVVSGDTVYPEVIPAIVDYDTFAECNRIMDEHKHKQREVYVEKPYILSGKLYCGYCNSLMTAESGTSKTGRIYHYYKCFYKKRNKDKCTKRNYVQKELENLVFKKTIEYVLQPAIIRQIAEIVVNRFNSEIAKSTTITALENDLKDKEKAINSIMKAIEQGIITKTTQRRLLDLEAQKEEIETKLSVERSRQIQPLCVEKVKTFLNYYARKKYDNDEEKNEFFSSFIRVILFDDRVVILYNTGKEDKVKVDNKELINGIGGDNDKVESLSEIAETMQNGNKKCKSFEPEFKRLAHGGRDGIRTHVPRTRQPHFECGSL